MKTGRDGKQRQSHPSSPGLLRVPRAPAGTFPQASSTWFPQGTPLPALCLAWNTTDTWVQTAQVSPSPP